MPYNYLFYTFSVNSNNTISYSSINATSILATTFASVWRLPEDCSKILAKPFVYIVNGSTLTATSSSYNWIDLDSYFTYGLISGKILRYNASSYTY